MPEAPDCMDVDLVSGGPGQLKCTADSAVMAEVGLSGSSRSEATGLAPVGALEAVERLRCSRCFIASGSSVLVVDVTVSDGLLGSGNSGWSFRFRRGSLKKVVVVVVCVVVVV